mgnify:CR=1 FL=1
MVENMSPQKNSFPSGFLYSATTGLGLVVVMVGLIGGDVVTSGVGGLTTAVVGGGGVTAITGGGGSLVFCVDGRGTIAAVADGDGVVGSEEQILKQIRKAVTRHPIPFQKYNKRARDIMNDISSGSICFSTGDI